MWHPMLISCAEEISFHFVLYSWTGYALLAVLLAFALSVATCGRTLCIPNEAWEQREDSKRQVRLQVVLMVVLIVFMTVAMLLWPTLELIEVKGYTQLISQLYKNIEEDWVTDRLKPVLRNLPFLFYLLQPILLIVAFKEMQERLKTSGRKVAFDLKPRFKRQFSCRITAV